MNQYSSKKRFSERIFLSNNANTDKIVSTLRDGILTIEIPRVSEIKKIKTIEEIVLSLICIKKNGDG